MLDLAPQYLQIVRRLLQNHVPHRIVKAFGSRVRGTAKPHSDLDLVIMGDAPLDIAVMGALANAIADSELPFRVDLVDWQTISPEFQRIIAEVTEVIQ